VATFTDLTSTGARKAKVYAIAAIVLGAVSWLCIFAQPQVMAALNNNSSAEKTVTTSGDSSGWQPFSVSALNELLTANKTVLLDFTADWCQTCQVNEKTVLSNSAVQAKLKELNVVKMRADWTRQDPDISKLLSKFGRAGVPLYVIFPAGKAQSPIVLPEVITVPLVIDELNKAGKSQ
jgi:thiol:disulfide interchange protein DsbD